MTECLPPVADGYVDGEQDVGPDPLEDDTDNDGLTDGEAAAAETAPIVSSVRRHISVSPRR